jgi:hypothetical protein
MAFEFKKSLRQDHIAIAEFMTLYPELNYEQVAQAFDVSKQWICDLASSSAFRAKLLEFRDRIFTHQMGEEYEKLRLKILKTTDRAIDRLEMELETEDISHKDLNSTVEILLDSAGLGKRQASLQLTQVTKEEKHFHVSPDVMAEAAAIMGRPLDVIEEHEVSVPSRRNGSPALPSPSVRGEQTTDEERPKEEGSQVPEAGAGEAGDNL